MAIVAPTPIAALPPVPVLSDISTFSARTDVFINALPNFRTEQNNLASNVYNNALEMAAIVTSASDSADLAADQVVLATAQVSIATTQANNAGTSATEALNSATTATTQATNASTSYQNFDKRYLGNKAGDPSVDNYGGALVTGALYFNTTISNMKIYNGSVWVAAAGSITGSFAVARETATATAAQTVFNLVNSYTVGTNTLMVYRNGVRLLNSDYTETSASVVTLATPSTVGDELLFEIGLVSSGTSTGAGNITFTPTGSISSTTVQAALVELDLEKQPTLVSGVNIKTLNSMSIVGSGDIVMPSPAGRIFFSMGA